MKNNLRTLNGNIGVIHHYTEEMDQYVLLLTWILFLRNTQQNKPLTRVPAPANTHMFT